MGILTGISEPAAHQGRLRGQLRGRLRPPQNFLDAWQFTCYECWCKNHCFQWEELSAVHQLSDFKEHYVLLESSFSSQQGPEALLQLKVDVVE